MHFHAQRSFVQVAADEAVQNVKLPVRYQCLVTGEGAHDARNLKPPVCLAFWPKKYLVWQFLGTMARTNVRFSAVDKPYIWQRLSTQAFWLAASFWSCVIFRARATVPPTEKGLLLGISFVPIIFRSVGWLKCHRKMPTSMYGWSKKLGPCSCHLFPKNEHP